MNQVKWSYLNTLSFEMLRADFMRTLWNEEKPNPAYPNDTTKENTDEDIPKNINFTSSTITFGGGEYRRGISGYISEYLELNDRETLQAIFWEHFCDLADSIHTFTIGYNNDYWHEYPYDDDDDDDAINDYYEAREDDIRDLEEDIIDLARKVSKLNLEQKNISYTRTQRFINAKENYRDIKWQEIDKWSNAKKILLEQLELFFFAVGPDSFMSSYISEYLPKQTAQHFDWRLNPILRDIYLGYLTRNPFLVDLSGKILEDTQVSDLLFKEPKNSFKNALSHLDCDGKNTLLISDFDNLIKAKYKSSYLFRPQHTYEEVEEHLKNAYGSNFFIAE